LPAQFLSFTVTISDVKPADSHSEIVVIYDGDCAFCRECVRWVEKRAPITALPFQSADLAKFNLTYERCSQEVVATIDGKVFGGASAVAALLKVSGHRATGNLIMLSGPLGRRGYRWVASHRDGLFVRILLSIVRRFNRSS
jgi:predicted DCC family thiol-disulfide oxidoreductase YuxK